MLELGEHGEMVGFDEEVPTVFEGRQQVERLLEAVDDAHGWLPGRRLHSSERSWPASTRWDTPVYLGPSPECIIESASG